ncbi:MAG: zinc ABC transporter substrate-binding protein, partial [Treponema sp.]|nr:zinc ABC transporter substrate-binding protein [Treponema sp.]
MNRKKIFIISLLAIACIVALVALIALPKSAKKDGKFSVVATIFPLYDWAREVGAGNEEIEYTLLLNSGSDMHSFQPTVKDIATISSSDLFIYVGGESDKWVDDLLRTAAGKKLKALNLMDFLSSRILEEEIKEGMQVEEEEDEEGEEGELEYDEHIWLSLKNAVLCVGEIESILSSLDKNNASLYASNAASYIKRLKEVDGQYSDAVKNAGNKTRVFAGRFPFRYLVQDYGLDYFAAFSGCSAETEASFQTVRFLVNKVDGLDLNDVFVLESSDKKIARTV